MKAVRINDYGGPELLKYEDAPVPVIKDNEILVRVHAVSVNHLEIKKSAGMMKERSPLAFPWIPGYDFSGIVETAFPSSGFSKGQKVYGTARGGSYAEFLAADVSTTVAMPGKMSFIEAATVPHVGQTAWEALYEHGNLRKGQKILIHGAAGAVGSFAVQFACVTGAEIYATADKKDEGYLKALGADKVIDFRTGDFTKMVSDIDMVLLLVPGDSEQRSYTVMKPGGTLVSTVGIAAESEAKDKGINTIAMGVHYSGENLREITELIDAGKVTTDVEILLPLRNAEMAWRILGGKDAALPHISRGKIVLKTDIYDNP